MAVSDRARFRRFSASAVAAIATALACTGSAHAEPSLQDYRWFRALNIDLRGRIPTRSDLAEFEAPGFDVDAWIDRELTGVAYADRLLRIYMDALRLEFPDNMNVMDRMTELRRYPLDIAMPDGTVKHTTVFNRVGQRRAAPTRDKTFCFEPSETGQSYRPKVTPAQPTKAVPLATVNERAVKVRPWWLYRDYQSASPRQHYRTWSASEPRFKLADAPDKAGKVPPRGLLFEPDDTEVEEVWVCNEEAQTATKAPATILGQKVDVACTADIGMAQSAGCGCGKGLEWCVPGQGAGSDSQMMVSPTLHPFGSELPFEEARTDQSEWVKGMWHDEARHFLSSLFAEDADFRDVLTARYDWVNGPLAQFYRSIQSGDCCTDQVAIRGGVTLGEPERMFDPAKLPAGLLPTEMDRWVKVDDRGSHAAGILTLPAFLGKFATRRGRANAVYNTFLCREFVVDKLDLQPSEEPNLTIRPGCSTCHAKLEPLAAYFTRTKENSFAFLPAPVDNPFCAKKADGTMPTGCDRYYDPAFSTTTGGKLRGAHVTPEHADAGPAGFAQEIVKTPDFSSCATKTIVESMLGRRTATPTDDKMLEELTKLFEGGGFRMRALVRAVVKSNAYRNANAFAGGER